MSAEPTPHSVKTIAGRMLAPLRRPLKKLRKSLTGYTAFSPMDAYEIPRLTIQGLVAWSLPEAAWWRPSRLLGRLNVATHRERTRKEMAQIASLLANARGTGAAHEIAVANWANRYEERFHYLRAWRPGGWNPEIEIVGAEHVRAALEKRHGIIFWGGNFAFNNLLPKMTLHRLGLEVTGFSVPLHGISNTRFGSRYLNRLYRDIENRYLRERLMPNPQQIPAALERMRFRLRENGAVYFAVGGRARRTAETKFLRGRIIVATGPIAMAESMGAALLPLYTFRAGPSRFQVTIGPPIAIPKDQSGNVAYDAALQAYADALAPFVLRDPGQWQGWHLTRKREPWGGKRRALPSPMEAAPDGDQRANHA
jgi:lauroyl/myristoyl acyltransferase